MKEMTHACTSYIQYGEMRTGSTFQFWLLASVLRLRHIHRVRKTHVPLKPQDGQCYFVSRRTAHISDEWVRSNNVLHVQEYERFVADPLGELRFYQPIFNLTTQEMQQLHAHMMYWSIIRRCCGSQAAYDQRMHIHSSVDHKEYALRHPFESYDFADCDMYNLTRVEEYFARTTLTVEAMRDKNPIVVEYMRGNWRLGYCEDEATKLKNGLDFNGAKF